MKYGDWNDIHSKIDEEIKYIFKDYEMDKLSSYEKRQIIFEHLCKTLTYDINTLNNIKLFKQGKIKISRDPLGEILSVINNRVGICNAIAQYYKLLLEEVGVFSVCVICDDLTEVNHQLNLVYDEENDTYSFDDITNVIVEKGSMFDFFDYDLDQANKFGQGTRNNQAKEKWSIWPTSIINMIVGKDTENQFEDIEKIELIVPRIRSLKQSKHM